MKTRKDFERTARVITKQRETWARTLGEGGTLQFIQAAMDTLSKDFAREYAEENPHFDRTRFLNACGVDPQYHGEAWEKMSVAEFAAGLEDGSIA